MSLADDAGTIVGVNWGSTAFRAYLIAPDGTLLDDVSEAAGVTALDRAGMADVATRLSARWTGARPVYAAGMIGSNVGWSEAPYVEAPANIAALAQGAIPATIGDLTLRIVPGIACTRAFDGAPDILRGEEIELVGTMALRPGARVVALPGTHTKWAEVDGGRIVQFFTSMSGEIYDRLTKQGLLASVVAGEASDGDAFQEGVRAARQNGIGLGTLLFGARAKVVRGLLPRTEAASYVRGLLIGAELADASAMLPRLGDTIVTLVGNNALSRLYAAALATIGVDSVLVDSRDACVTGFRALHEARGD